MADLLNRKDIDFLLFEWLEIATLFDQDRFSSHGTDTVEALLDLAERLAEDKFLNHYKKADANEPEITADGSVRIIPEIGEGVRAFADAGMLAAPFDEAVGGLQLPQLVYQAAMAHFFAANVATAAYPMLTTANARLIAAFGTPKQVEVFAKPALTGDHLGTMCLSEPQAGSSLADIRTRAVRDGDSDLGPRYRITGNKMWISGGEHQITPNIVHLVLAKVADAGGKTRGGTKGISLFIVPRLLPDGSRNDIGLAGLNHKMGYRGTTNTLLNFGEGSFMPEGSAGAVGFLVGSEGEGLPQMFQMMNEARIGVGLGAAALGYRGYRLALRYASERTQGRAHGADPSSPPVAIIEHADVKRQLLTAKAYAEGALALVLYCSKLVDEVETGTPADAAAANILLGLLTPVAKTWPSEFGLAANDIAIQVHGGYGYTRDFDVEQLYRDNRLNPIHEGTTGIQALDLLGRKTLRDAGRSYTKLAPRIARSVERAGAVPALCQPAVELAALWQIFSGTVDKLVAENDAIALVNATPFLSAFGHVVLTWLWVDQAAAAFEAAARGSVDEAFARGKISACRHFLETETPRVATWLRIVAGYSDLAAGMDPADF